MTTHEIRKFYLTNHHMNKQKKIVLPGGAGLVGQNLIIHLKSRGYRNLIVLDKHLKNMAILKSMHPDILIEYADLAEPDTWEIHFKNADVVVMLQAQIGHTEYEPFHRNNVQSTENIIAAIKKYNVPYTIHISSSVIESLAYDYYTRSKKQQEDLVLNSGIDCVILRPTLMFGWFDRKHLGWLSRFMKKTLVFPIPGHGQYLRQPLYVADFCNIIISCIEKPIPNKIFNITGLEQIHYIDIIREIKKSTRAKCALLKIPYNVFYNLLKCWEYFDKNPPFTSDQLNALIAKDFFEVIDWPGIFSVKSTPFIIAIHETFNHPSYSQVVLDF